MRRFSIFCIILPILLMLSYGHAAAFRIPPDHGSDQATTRSDPQVEAQQDAIRFKNLGVEEGLSQSSVRAIVQDQQGFLWLGTEDGLNRYDGYQFKIYRPIPNDPQSLSNRWITDLYEDRDGYLWIATRQGGLNRYDPRTDSFIRYRNAKDDPSSLISDSVQCIAQDSTGNLWIGTEKGLDRLNPKTGAIQHYLNGPTDPNRLSGTDVMSLFIDKKDTVWVGTYESGLIAFDPSAKTFKPYRSDSKDTTSLSGNEILSIQEGLNENLWLATDNGVDRLNPRTGQIKRFTLSPGLSGNQSSPTIDDIFVDRNGILWIGTDQGLYRLDQHTEQITNSHHIAAIQDSLSNNVVLSIAEDREGVLWIGSYGGGVDKYNQEQDKFRYVRHDPENSNSLTNNLVFSFFVDPSGVTWIATEEGLDRFDPSTGQFAHFKHDASQPGSLSDDFVWRVFRDSKGKLWVGTRKALDQFDESTHQFIHYQHDPKNPDSLTNSKTYFIYEDSRADLWIGTAGGLDRFERETGKFIHYRDPNAPDKTTEDAVGSIQEDANGRLWVGTFNMGIYRLDGDRKKFTYYQNDPKTPGSLSNNTILSIHQSRDGALWVASTDGLDQYNPSSDSFTTYTEQNGLPNNVVYGIVEDKKGLLWLSTNFGISRFDPAAKTFRNYTSTDGLQGNEFNQGAYALGPDGNIYFGGTNGYNVFNPDQVQDNSILPPVALTALTTNGKPFQSTTAIPALHEITLQWPQDSFEFDFTALSFAAPQNNRYAYKLVAFDKEWNQLGNKRSGRYTNLPGGTYTLLLKASNGDGVWNETGEAIRVTVIAPFWKTGWFYGLVGLALIGCVAAIYRLRVRDMEIQKQELERLVNVRTQEIEQLFEENKELAVMEERNRLARDLHDSAKQKAFASLAQLGAASGLLNQDPTSARKHLGEAENLVYEVIQELTFLIQEMYPIALKEKGLVNALREYVFEWETRTDIRVNMHIEGEGHLPLAIEQAIYRIVQESLANIARHSHATQVEFAVVYQNETVEVSIADNGQGFDPEQKPNGIGLRSMYERAKSVGGIFAVQTMPGQGTHVKITVPALEQDHSNGGRNG
jgi:ligand-binding sensor domain-containing protein/signal transduction histidine kinase